MEEKESPSWLVKQGFDEEPEKRASGSRILQIQRMIKGVTDPEEIMLELMEVLTETEIVPDVGNYYTYIFNAKTPNITYDQHPLVAVLEIFNWGFRGLNFHWQDINPSQCVRNYTWAEIPGRLHTIYKDEIEYIKGINYSKFIINR
jgi:hypothetical protein